MLKPLANYAEAYFLQGGRHGSPAVSAFELAASVHIMNCRAVQRPDSMVYHSCGAFSL